MKMMHKPFSQPQTQSKLGIIFIFLGQSVKFVRIFGAAVIYFFLKGFEANSELVSIALSVLIGVLLLLLGFSYLSFQRFRFYIDYDNREFILQKGVFNTEVISLPFSKIQQVYFRRSLLQRLIGVYSVILDTAGSSAQEINIKALSESEAKDLQQILMEEVTAQKQQETNDVEATADHKSGEDSVAVHKLSVLALLKLGLTSNYFRGVWLILIFLGSLYQQFGEFQLIEESQYREGIRGYFEAYSKPVELLVLTALVFVAMFILGIFISSIEIFIKYFDLTLKQTKDSLELEMGLKTNTKVSLKPRRVQLMRIVTNPVQKRLNLNEAQIAIASSRDDLQKSQISIPGMERMQLERVKKFLFTYRMRPGRVFKPAYILYLRLIIIAGLPLVLTAIVGSVVVPNYMVEIGLVLLVIYAGLVVPYQFFWYKALSLEITPEFVIKRKGVWTQKTEILELYKLQSVSVTQPFWYKRRGLYNYTFHTAGGDISFPVTTSKMQRYINYALYRVEIDKKAWM
ncbi:PH domain-containing protein [Leeuwenhoekiella sp. H156]|uniref:PH domain-containing protein n=1 Tax=Leeuwenhoekiella sp. H156 TaxID=3450128 RepID=UPI003FA4ADFA